LEIKKEYWKSRVLDTGKRNKMIHYKETSRATLKLLPLGLMQVQILHKEHMLICMQKLKFVWLRLFREPYLKKIKCCNL
jgi:hypothetical protein